MPSRRRDELAAAQQQIRDLRNQAHNLAQPFREQIQGLEVENRALHERATRAEARAAAATDALDALVAYLATVKKGQ